MSYREKRKAERISCELAGSIISTAGTFEGVIEDISEDGIRFSALTLSRTIAPAQDIRLVFPIFSDEKISLNCKVKWARSVPDGRRSEIGMRISKKQNRYKELVRNIYLSKYM